MFFTANTTDIITHFRAFSPSFLFLKRNLFFLPRQKDGEIPQGNTFNTNPFCQDLGTSKVVA